MEKITTLYDGEVELKFLGPTEESPNRHMYYVKDHGRGDTKWKRASGSTTFIGIKDKSMPLSKWQQRITVEFLLNALDEGKEIDHDLAIEAAIQNDIQKKEAADLGTQIHDWVEKYIQYQIGLIDSMPDMPEDPKVQQGCIAFLDWHEQHGYTFKSTERLVYSRELEHTGTLDIEALNGSHRYLIDLKSSNGLYNGVRMQTASYLKADQEESGRPYKGRWAIRLSKLTEDEYYEQEKLKNEIRKYICDFRGWDYKEYPIKPYEVFEAKYLDDEPHFLERDYQAFINARELHAWNKKTDPYRVGDNW